MGQGSRHIAAAHGSYWSLQSARFGVFRVFSDNFSEATSVPYLNQSGLGFCSGEQDPSLAQPGL